MSVINKPNDATTVVLNGEILADLAVGDTVTMEFPNQRTSRINSAGGGLTVNGRTDADVCNMTIRVEKYSDTDVFLNSAANAVTPTILNGSLKTDFQRDGVDSVETYTLNNGSLTGQPTNTKNNEAGNAVMEYVVQFRSAVRSL